MIAEEFFVEGPVLGCLLTRDQHKIFFRDLNQMKGC